MSIVKDWHVVLCELCGDKQIGAIEVDLVTQTRARDILVGHLAQEHPVSWLARQQFVNMGSTVRQVLRNRYEADERERRQLATLEEKPETAAEQPEDTLPPGKVVSALVADIADMIERLAVQAPRMRPHQQEQVDALSALASAKYALQELKGKLR